MYQHLVRRGDGVEVRDIFVGADLALGDDGLRLDGALARHEVHVVATQTALTDADTRAVFHIDVSLIEVGLYAEGDLTAHLHEEATADIGEGSGIVAQRLMDGLQDVADLLLEVHIVLHDMQMGVSRPSLEDASIEVTRLLYGLVARSVVLQRVEFLRALCCGDHMDDSVVARITELDLRETQLIKEGLPHRALDIVRDVHRPSIGDDEHGMGSGVCELEEGILHLQLVLHHSLLDVVEVLTVGRAEVDRRITKERRCLGECVDEVTEVTEVLDDLRKGGGLTCARAAGEGDAGDILVHL